MKTLYLGNMIEMGEYAGVTLGTCLALYGRKSLLKVLKYYDIPNEILRANHYHKVGDEEPIEEEMTINDSFMEENFEKTPTFDMDDWFEEWLRDEMRETSTTNDPNEDEEEYEDDPWGMEGRIIYDKEYFEDEWSSDAYKPWIYGN